MGGLICRYQPQTAPGKLPWLSSSSLKGVKWIHLLDRWVVDLQDEALTAWLAGEASALAEGAVQVPALLDFPPSLVTAALLYVARRAAGTYPAWPPCLSTLTGA